jgi:hypothetical protein
MLLVAWKCPSCDVQVSWLCFFRTSLCSACRVQIVPRLIFHLFMYRRSFLQYKTFCFLTPFTSLCQKYMRDLSNFQAFVYDIHSNLLLVGWSSVCGDHFQHHLMPATKVFFLRRSQGGWFCRTSSTAMGSPLDTPGKLYDYFIERKS